MLVKRRTSKAMARPGIGRRRFLQIATGVPFGVAGWLATGCAPESEPGPFATPGPPRLVSPDGEAVVAPKVNGAVNVHPLRCWGCLPSEEAIDPALVSLQLSAAYELGMDGIRITAPLGDRNSFL